MPSKRYLVVGVATLIVATGGFITGALAAGGGARPSPSGNPSVPLVAHLLGGAEQVVPTLGDPDGGATALVNVNGALGEVCVEVTTDGIGTPWTLAHIHQGKVGIEGPVVVDFGGGRRRTEAVEVRHGRRSIAHRRDQCDPEQLLRQRAHDRLPGGRRPGSVGGAARSQTQFLTPTRVYDSRQGADGKLAVGTTRIIDLKVPLGVRARLITLTVDGTEDGGYVTAYAADVATVPPTSTINWTETNQAVGTTTTVVVDRDGKIKLTAGQNGTHVIVDVLGFIV